VHDRQQIPTLIKDTVTDLADDVSIGPILCRSKVAGLDVMAEGQKSAAHDAAGFAGDQCFSH